MLFIPMFNAYFWGWKKVIKRRKREKKEKRFLPSCPTVFIITNTAMY